MEISGKLVDIHRRAIYGAEVRFEKGRIVSIEEKSNVPDRFLLPGFIDAHVHIESSMATPGAFAVAAVPHGTIEVVSDPHEIANVMGIAGVRFMLDDSEKVPMRFSFGAPGCVPATSFESSGAVIDSKAIEILLADDRIRFLSEMMNFPGVVSSAPEVMAKIGYAKRAGKPVDGHAPGLTGNDLKKYVQAGITTDHECTTMDEAMEKIALGMKILIREGSAARNLESLHQLIARAPEMVMLCCDDIHPDELVERHINGIVTDLLRRGYDLFDVLRAASLNPVNHYKLSSGLLRIGDSADFIVTDDLAEMKILSTYIKGELVYHEGKVMFNYERSGAFNNFNSSTIASKDITKSLGGKKVRVMEAFDGDLFTGSREALVPPKKPSGYNVEDDILKIVVKERYNDNGPVVGFIRGFGIREGAMASSVAHDSHNIIAVGTSDEYICRAVNRIVEMKGGLAWSGPEGDLSLPLNIAGIISSAPVHETAELYKKISGAARAAGSQLTAPFMTMSFMALLVIPELKIGDRGLFDVSEFKEVPLIVEK